MGDIKLTIGSTTKSLDLYRDSKDQKDWQVTKLYDIDIQSDKFFEQTDWVNGFGQGDYKETLRYSSGQNIDTTNKGNIILGPKSTATYVKLVLSAAIADDGGAFTDETTASLYYSTTNDMTLLPAAPAVNDAYYFGGSFAFTKLDLTIGTQGAGVWTITWEYYDTDTSWKSLSGLTDDTTGFTAAAGEHSVTFTLPATWATTTINGQGPYYYIRARVSAYTSIATQPLGDGARIYSTTTGPGSTLKKLVYFNSTNYSACGTSLYEWDNTNEIWTLLKTFGATITDICVYNSKLYIALGSSTSYEYTSDGITFTATDLTDDDFTLFITAPSSTGTSTILWGADSNNVKSTSNPDASGTQWSDAYTIGDSTTSITGLMLYNDMLLIGKSDGLWWLDSSSRVKPLMPELQIAQSTNNFKYHVIYKGSLYFTLNTRIGELTSSATYNTVDPFQNIEELTTISSCTGLACDRDYLYAIMYDGTNYVIYKGFKISETEWSWCPYFTQATNSMDYLAVTQIGSDNPKLWYNSTTSYIAYSVLSDNPLGDSSYAFNTSGGYLYTGWYDAGNRDWTKILESVVSECIGWDVDSGSVDLSANVKVTISYEIDEGSTTAIDTAYTDNNPKSAAWVKKYVDASTLANGQKVRFKIALATNDSTITPVVKYFAAYGQVRPPNRNVYDFTVSVDPKYKKSETIWDFLESGRDSTALITLNDRFKNNVYVEFYPGYPKQIERRDEAGKQSTLVAQVKCVEIDWS